MFTQQFVIKSTIITETTRYYRHVSCTINQTIKISYCGSHNSSILCIINTARYPRLGIINGAIFVTGEDVLAWVINNLSFINAKIPFNIINVTIMLMNLHHSLLAFSVKE